MIKADIKLAVLKKQKNELEKEIAEVKQAHRRNEFAKTNTYQLFVLEQRLEFINQKIACREKE